MQFWEKGFNIRLLRDWSINFFFIEDIMNWCKILIFMSRDAKKNVNIYMFMWVAQYEKYRRIKNCGFWDKFQWLPLNLTVNNNKNPKNLYA